MKKIRIGVIGALIGFTLSLGFGAHAEVLSMIGKTIDGSFPIKINGKTLTNQALTIEGVSYVPTREFAESLGAEIKFDADLGIEVVPLSTPTPSEQPTTTPENTTMKRLNEIKNEMLQLIPEIQALQDKINKATSKDVNGNVPKDDNLELYKQQITEKEAQLENLKQERDSLYHKQ